MNKTNIEPQLIPLRYWIKRWENLRLLLINLKKIVMAQTAIEWLIETQKAQMGMLFESDIEKAKQMEKQQIIDFTNEFIEKHTFGDYEGMVQKNKTVQQYYDEKFKKKEIIMAQGGNKNYKINTLLSWLDAADQTNKEDKLTSVTLFSDGSGRILLDGKEVDDFFTIEEAFEKLETTINTQKSC